MTLFSCLTGAKSDGFAQKLADSLGAPVRAPNDIAWLFTEPPFVFVTARDEEQTEVLTPRFNEDANGRLIPTGEWIDFEPSRDRDSWNLDP